MNQRKGQSIVPKNNNKNHLNELVKQ